MSTALGLLPRVSWGSLKKLDKNLTCIMAGRCIFQKLLHAVKHLR